MDTGREQAKRVVRNGKKDTTTSPLCWIGVNTDWWIDPPYSLASHCNCHCSTCVARAIWARSGLKEKVGKVFSESPSTGSQSLRDPVL